ncbi:MAG: aspartate/tyrosine/aromatic aminotransferase [Nitratireductor sp.]|nr:aspartate/tyrosine/aromatic aminotransferase [Nitratireductor sp.]
MFDRLPQQPQDKILGLMQIFREDPRGDKIDLGVGVYRNAQGVTPVMRAIKAAERRLWEEEQTKAYTALAGTPEFSDAMIGLVLGGAVARDCVAAAATPGGTGALRQAFELIRMASPGAAVWISDPSWPNHASILNHLGMPVKQYRYFDRAAGTVDFEAMCEDISGAAEGDVLLLHGCCHNPTGANLTADEWDAVIDIMTQRRLFPMIDIAYQGFGDGLEEDAAGVRKVASSMPETLIAASCSKNFGIYRERTGIVMAVSQDKARQKLIQTNLAHLNRQNFSFPPDHGARLVSMILTDAALRRDWQEELESVRLGMLALREQLAAELRRRTNSDRYEFIARHRGMFSMTGISPQAVDRLREEHGIYMIGDSRLNIAGLNEETVPILAEALAAIRE